MIQVCKQCNKEYDSLTAKSKYCSKSCAELGLAEYKKQWALENSERIASYRQKRKSPDDKLKAKEYNAAWYLANKQTISLRQKEKYSTDSDFRKLACERVKKYNKTPRAKEIKKQKYQELRLKVILAYGGKCSCCGEYRIKFLTVEHVNNDGNLDRKNHIIGVRLYNKIVKLGFPKDFTILCYNCNCSKGVYGACPHQEEREALDVAKHILSQNVFQPRGQTTNYPA